MYGYVLIRTNTHEYVRIRTDIYGYIRKRIHDTAPRGHRESRNLKKGVSCEHVYQKLQKSLYKRSAGEPDTHLVLRFKRHFGDFAYTCAKETLTSKFRSGPEAGTGPFSKNLIIAIVFL